MNNKKRTISLFVISILCLVVYNIIGVEVDSEGFLREAFYLIPMFYLFLVGSIISFGYDIYITKKQGN